MRSVFLCLVFLAIASGTAASAEVEVMLTDKMFAGFDKFMDQVAASRSEAETATFIMSMNEIVVATKTKKDVGNLLIAKRESLAVSIDSMDKDKTIITITNKGEVIKPKIEGTNLVVELGANVSLKMVVNTTTKTITIDNIDGIKLQTPIGAIKIKSISADKMTRKVKLVTG